MVCRLVAMDKRLGVCPVEIGEMLHRTLAKLVMRVAGDQANTACGNLPLCAGLEACIEGVNHAVGERRMERREEGEVEEEEGCKESEEEEEEEERTEATRREGWMNLKLGGTEREAEENIGEALGMEVGRE